VVVVICYLGDTSSCILPRHPHQLHANTAALDEWISRTKSLDEEGKLTPDDFEFVQVLAFPALQNTRQKIEIIVKNIINVSMEILFV
jgi:hypothetical protein